MATVYEYTATVTHVVDGDTVFFNLTKNFVLDVDFGFRIKDQVTLSKSADMNFRLLGINAPEMHGATAEKGKAAKIELERLLSLGLIRVVTSKSDKYGRWLADIYVTPPGAAEFNVNQRMIDGGFAVPFMV